MGIKSRGCWNPWRAAATETCYRLLFLGLWATALGGTLTGAINCLSLVDESQWSLIIIHNPDLAVISLAVAAAGPEVLTCLNRQPDAKYR